MGRIPDFIGLGAQKAGTSWIYACLYEHPQIWMPVKEVHFFSRQKNWAKGYDWYENLFNQAPRDAKTGEFCTSYLADPSVPARIYTRYPAVRLIASLRNPVDRAYSNYVNDIKAGVVLPQTPFAEALNDHHEYIEQGRYATQLKHYLRFFPREQMLLEVYEDCLHQPLEFIQRIYTFLEVNSDFTPAMIHKRVNVSKVPRFVWLEKLLIQVSDFLHNKGFQQIWWFAKGLGIADQIRKFNLQNSMEQGSQPQPSWRELVYRNLETEIQVLEEILGRELQEWRL